MKAPRAITFVEVYRLLNPGTVFAMYRKEPNPLCPVGRRIQQGLGGYYERAQASLERKLDKISITDVLDGVVATGNQRPFFASIRNH